MLDQRGDDGYKGGTAIPTPSSEQIRGFRDCSMMKQNEPALILRLKFAGEPRWHVHAILRMKLDGAGRLLYWDADTGNVVAVDATALESVGIQPIACARKAA